MNDVVFRTTPATTGLLYITLKLTTENIWYPRWKVYFHWIISVIFGYYRHFYFNFLIFSLTQFCCKLCMVKIYVFLGVHTVYPKFSLCKKHTHTFFNFFLFLVNVPWLQNNISIYIISNILMSLKQLEHVWQHWHVYLKTDQI